MKHVQLVLLSKCLNKKLNVNLKKCLHCTLYFDLTTC